MKTTDPDLSLHISFKGSHIREAVLSIFYRKGFRPTETILASRVTSESENLVSALVPTGNPHSFSVDELSIGPITVVQMPQDERIVWAKSILTQDIETLEQLVGHKALVELIKRLTGSDLNKNETIPNPPVSRIKPELEWQEEEKLEEEEEEELPSSEEDIEMSIQAAIEASKRLVASRKSNNE